ncbi:HVO_2142 family zinc finger protein [Salinigranum halophilum]|uniref:HVO_2142 family zinc finger protein n=2 Tax=Salinigranum halophilum TaxID=2565931 RepID=UPI00115CE4E0|nr:HVO_2142 family zinc finger protein [Salinigranum halophilum]
MKCDTVAYLMVTLERPSSVSAEYCPSCDTEMLFSGTQPAGLAQFFCEVCDYRYDRLIDA